MLMTSSEQEKRLLFQIQLFQSKAVVVLNVSAKYEKAAPILRMLFSDSNC